MLSFPARGYPRAGKRLSLYPKVLLLGLEDGLPVVLRHFGSFPLPYPNLRISATYRRRTSYCGVSIRVCTSRRWIQRTGT